MDGKETESDPILDSPLLTPDVSANDDTRFALQVVQGVNALIAALDRLQALRREWDALNLGEQLKSDAIGRISSGVTPENLGNVFNTVAEIDALLAQGHATNLYRLRGRGL